MRNGIVAAAAVAWALAPGAWGQAAAPAAGAPTAAGQPWEGGIAEAFFSDEAMTMPRPEAEIRANWQSLPPEDRDQVRRDCEAMRVDIRDLGGGASGGIADVDTPPAPEAAETEASEGALAMQRVCAIVTDP